MVPDNIVEATFSSTKTINKKRVKKYRFVNKTAANLKNAKNISTFLKNEVINPWSTSRDPIQVIREEKSVLEYRGQEKYNTANILGILVFSVVFGVMLSILGDGGKPMTQWFKCIFDVTMKMIEIFIWFSPIGISSLIAGNIVAMEDIQERIISMGMFITTMIVGCLTHSLVTLPSIYLLMVRKNPYLLLSRVAKALVTSFGTGSSAAALPITITCLVRNHKVDKRVAKFVIPIGTTVNMNGAAIQIAIIAIYIVETQHGGIVDFGSLVILCLVTTLTAFAAPPIPGSGPILAKTIALQAIGIHSADIGLFLSIDWIVDRISTVTNVWANCITAAIVEHLSRKDILALDGGENNTVNPCTVDFEINVAVEIEEE